MVVSCQLSLVTVSCQLSVVSCHWSVVSCTRRDGAGAGGTERGELVKKSYDGLSRPSRPPFDGLERPSTSFAPWSGGRGAKSGERGAGGTERGARSGEHAAGSTGRGARSEEHGAGGTERGARSEEFQAGRGRLPSGDRGSRLSTAIRSSSTPARGQCRLLCTRTW